MKQSKHDIAYFLTNPNFVRWVKNPTENNEFFWKKWLKNHPEDKEAFHNAKAVLERTKFKEADISQNRKEEILDNILKNKHSGHYRNESFFRIGMRKVYPWLMGAAAAIFIAFVAFEFLYDNNQAIINGSHRSDPYITSKHSGKGERISFLLPDSTMVILNAESTLTYPSEFGTGTRKVTLTGEAYFDVRHDAQRKFLVKSRDVVTSVEGTAFNVKAYCEDPTAVSLERGYVSVYPEYANLKGKSFKIVPGEKLTVNEDFGKSEKSLFDFEKEFGWTKGVLVFKDADVKVFVSALERWYGIQIIVLGGNSRNWALNGRFKNQSLENVLKSLEFSKGISYEIKDKQVTINLNQNSN